MYLWYFIQKKFLKIHIKSEYLGIFLHHEKMRIWQFKQNHESKAEQNLLSAICFINSFKK